MQCDNPTGSRVDLSLCKREQNSAHSFPETTGSHPVHVQPRNGVRLLDEAAKNGALQDHIYTALSLKRRSSQ